MSRSGKSLLGSLLQKHALRALDDLISNSVDKHLNKPQTVNKRNKTMTVVFGNNTNTNSNTDEKVVPQVYLNIGQTVDVPQADGSTAKEFVSIPVGISIDTMAPFKATGKDATWLAKVGIKNALLAQLQAFGENMDAGTSEMVEGLEIQILRRQTPAEAPSAEDNPITTTPLRLVGAAA